jgi:hypothetical protein
MSEESATKADPSASAEIRDRVEKIQVLLKKMPAGEAIRGLTGKVPKTVGDAIARLTNKELNAHVNEINTVLDTFHIDNLSGDERRVVAQLRDQPNVDVEGITYAEINRVYNSLLQYHTLFDRERSKRAKEADDRRTRRRAYRKLELPEPLTDKELTRRPSIAQREAATTLGYRSDRQVRKLVAEGKLHKTKNGRIVVDDAFHKIRRQRHASITG